ncbi:MAG: type II secretion system protein [Minisyncoccia bacterium]
MKIKKMLTTRPNLVRGFTLIELLVVIAIIGILSSIVLVSLSTARDKAANAGVKSNISGIRNQAEISYDENNNLYTSVCSDSKVMQALSAASLAGTATTTSYICNDDDNYWVAQTPLKIADNDGSTLWCIDSSGSPKGGTTAIIQDVDTSCP